MRRPRLVLAGMASVLALLGMFFVLQPQKPKGPPGFQVGPATIYPRVDLDAGTTLRQDYDRLHGASGK